MKTNLLTTKLSNTLLLVFYLINLQAHTHLHSLTDQHHGHVNGSEIVVYPGEHSACSEFSAHCQDTHKHPRHCTFCESDFSNAFIKSVKTTDKISQSPLGNVVDPSNSFCPEDLNRYTGPGKLPYDYLQTQRLSDRAPPSFV